MSRRRRIAGCLLALGSMGLALWLVFSWPWLMREPVGPPQRELPPEIECDCAKIFERKEPDTGIDWKKYDQLKEQVLALVGHTEADIVARYGPPSYQWKGHYGLPNVEFTSKYPDEVTAVYNRGTCTLYVSFCRSHGRLVCHWANMVPEGTRF